MRTMIFVLLILSGPMYAAAETLTDYQTRRLLAPTPAERSTELRGKIYIYDGLTSEQIEMALNRHFDRMNSMMFVRTVQIYESGGEYVEDDGCE